MMRTGIAGSSRPAVVATIAAVVMAVGGCGMFGPSAEERAGFAQSVMGSSATTGSTISAAGAASLGTPPGSIGPAAAVDGTPAGMDVTIDSVTPPLPPSDGDWAIDLTIAFDGFSSEYEGELCILGGAFTSQMVMTFATDLPTDLMMSFVGTITVTDCAFDGNYDFAADITMGLSDQSVTYSGTITYTGDNGASEVIDIPATEVAV